MEDEQFIPPSDAVEVKSKIKFIPPSDAVEVKKKDNSQSSGEDSQKVSPTPQKVKTSLLGGGNQGKAQSAWDTLSGKSKKPMELGGFQVPTYTKPKTGGVKKTTSPVIDFNHMNVEQLASFDKGEEVVYQANPLQSAFGGGVSKAKKDTNTSSQFNQFISQNYNTASRKMSAAAVTKQDLNNINEEWNDVLNEGNSTFFNLKKGAVNAFNTALSAVNNSVSGIETPKTTLDIYRDNVKKEAIKNKEVLSPKDIDQRAKSKFIEERILSVKQSKINNVKEELSPGEQYAVSMNKLNQYKHLDSKNKQLVQTLHEVIASTDGLVKDKNDILSQISSFKNKGQQVPLELQDKLNDIQYSININSGIIKTKREEFNKNKKDLGSLSDEVQLWSSENNELVNLAKGIQGYLYKGIGNILHYQGEYAKKSGLPLMNTVGEFEQKQAEKLINKGEDITEGRKIYKDVRIGGNVKETEINKGTVVNDILNTITKVTSDNLGMVATMAFGGEVGLGLQAIETAGGKSREVQQENQAFKQTREDAIKNNEKIFEFNGETYNVKDYDNKEYHGVLAQHAAPLAWGAAMMLPMGRQLRWFQNESRIIAALEKESPDLLINSQKESFIKTAAKTGLNFASESFKLGTDLKIMALSQATIDDSLGKPVDYYKVALDIKPYLSAPYLHAMNKGFAYALAQTSKPYMTDKEAKEIDNNSKILFGLTEELRKENISTEESSIIKKQIDRVSKENQVHIDNVLDRMGNMSNESYKKVIELTRKSSELRLEASSVQASDMVKENKQKSLDNIRKDYVSNEKELKDLISNYKVRQDGFYGLSEREKSKYTDKALSDLKEKGEKYSTRDLNIRAEEIYNIEKNPVAEEKATPEENIFYYKNDKDLSYEKEGKAIVPEGYTTVKKVENSAEIKLWEEQQGKTTETTPNEQIKGVEDEVSKPIELEVTPKTEAKPEEVNPSEPEVKIEQKQKRGRKAKVEEETPKTTEETKVLGKEDVSLPKDITNENVDDIIKMLVDKGIATKPCE